MSEETPSHLARWLPWLVAILFFALVTSGVYRKAQAAHALPLYDSLSYYLKAANVWHELQTGHPENVFSADPTIRPPGSVIASAPFGPPNLARDFRGFYFRTIMVPIALWALAIMILLVRRRRPLQDQWLTVAAIAGLVCLPMFFQFESNDALPATFVWGFQDGLAAALAALALALLLASIPRRSLLLSMLGGGVAAWTLLVKPVGILIMAAVYGLWAVEAAAAFYFGPLPFKRDRRAWLYLGLTAFLLPILFGAVLFVCLHSAYLSAANWANAHESQSAVRALVTGHLGGAIADTIKFGVGPVWALLTLAGIGWALTRMLGRSREGLTPIILRTPAALLVFCAAVVWWITMAGAVERYLFPFQLCLLLSVLSAHWNLFLETATLRWKRILSISALVVGAGFCGLLHSAHPPLGLQKSLGFNLSSGLHRAEIQTAQKLLKRVRAVSTHVRVYKAQADTSLGTVESSLLVGRPAQSTGTFFYFFCPFAWKSNLVLNREELIDSDFILFTPTNSGPSREIPKYLGTFAEELAALSPWLTTLGPDDGVKLLSAKGPRLLEITDRLALDRAFQRWMNQHQWRPAFEAKNRVLPKDLFRQKFDQASAVFTWSAVTPPIVAQQLILHPEGPSWRIRATGDDPFMGWPAFQLPPKSHALLRMEISAPFLTQTELFWKTPETEFNQINHQTQFVSSGWSEIFFELPVTPETLQIRFDPGQVAGDYRVRSFEVRALPNP